MEDFGQPCPSGHPTVAVTPRVALCEECRVVYSVQGRELVWDNCPLTQELAFTLLDFQRRVVVQRVALADAVEDIDCLCSPHSSATLARVLLAPPRENT
jgi:hypothetical protein